MSRAGILLTGGTGALGRELLPLLTVSGEHDVWVLTRDPERAASVLSAPASGSRAELVQGDVTRGADLGLRAAEAARMRERVTHVIHLAAETRFTRPIAEARRVNVEGTRAVLAFARGCAGLRAVACASTVYVAGTRTGVILERDEHAAAWVNSYEQSKHEMEAVARDAMRTMPLALYRLSTVIGHSVTGAVSSPNAIHHALRLFYQGLAPMVPGRLDAPVDLVPVDFAARALHHLVMRRFEPGVARHLAAGATRSCTLDELLDLTVRAFEGCRPAWRKRRIERPAVVDADAYALFTRSVAESGNLVLQAATQAVQAFAGQLACPKTFDTGHTDAALAGSGITMPHVRAFYGRIVAWCVETNWGARAPDGAAA